MFKELNHKTFLVGGAVRNLIMGKEAKDYDYVIENTTEEEFVKVFPEAKKVGDSFPVYLINGHEVALARTEKSTGDSYTDFEFIAGVSINDDLSRRDLSINSIAKHYVTGEIVDPHNGVKDIHSRIIRTINPVAFIEDPLRIYRAVRFAVEFDFEIEKETAKLMSEAKDGLKHITPERVHLELEKVYKRSDKPARFFEILEELDLLKTHFKPFYVATKVSAGPSEYHHGKSVFQHLMDSFNKAKELNYNFDLAIAGLVHDFGKIITPKEILPQHIGHEHRGLKLIKKFFEQHRFTARQQELALAFSEHHMRFHVLLKIKKDIKLVRFYKAIRRHADDIVKAAYLDHGLNEEQVKILDDLKRTFKETVIDIPKEVQNKGRESIVSFVENAYTKTYREIKND